MLYRLLAAVPLALIYRLSDLLYLWLFHVLRYRRAVVDANIARVFPDYDDAARRNLARRFYRGFCDVLLEAVKGAALAPEVLRGRVTLHGADLPGRLAAEHGGVIVLAGHVANWEWLLLACSLDLDLPIDAVYKPLHNRATDDFMLRLRSRFGARTVPAQEAITRIAARRGQRRAIALVADQTPGRTEQKFWARFLGQDTPFYLGAEMIARFTRFPVLFAAMRRESRGRYTVRFEELAAPPYARDGHAVMDAYVRALETAVYDQPENWLWSHRKWKYARGRYE